MQRGEADPRETGRKQGSKNTDHVDVSNVWYREAVAEVQNGSPHRAVGKWGSSPPWHPWLCPLAASLRSHGRGRVTAHSPLSSGPSSLARLLPPPGSLPGGSAQAPRSQVCLHPLSHSAHDVALAQLLCPPPPCRSQACAQGCACGVLAPCVGSTGPPSPEDAAVRRG